MIALSLFKLLTKGNFMIGKIVTTTGKFVAKKTGMKVLEKTFDTYGNLKRKTINNTIGGKPLNVGERETIKCLQSPHNSLKRCKAVGAAARRAYLKTGKY